MPLGFFPQRDERAYSPLQLGQVLIPNINRFQERLSNIFRPQTGSHRPGVINDEPYNPYQQPINANQNQNINGDKTSIVFPSANGQPEFVQQNQPPTDTPNQGYYTDNQQLTNNRPVAFPTQTPVETNLPQNYQLNNEFQTNQNNYNQQSQSDQTGNVIILTPNQGYPAENANTYPTDQGNSEVNSDKTVYQPSQFDHREDGDGYKPGQVNFDQGQNNFNQGQHNLDQNQNNVNQGQTNQDSSDNFVTTEAAKYNKLDNGQETAETTTLAPLTPVPTVENRNFNFGPSGIFGN